MNIKGFFVRNLWRDERDATTFFLMAVPETVKEAKHGNIVVFAQIPRYSKGMPLSIYGDWEETDRGLRFKAKLVQEDTWSAFAARVYLTSAAYGNVSPAMADEIVEKFGYKKLFSFMKRDDAPQTLVDNIKNMTYEKALWLCSTLKTAKTERKLFDFVLRYGGFYSTAVKLQKEYGNNALEILCKDPFVGLKFGLKFEQCDMIGASCGFHAASPERIHAAAEAAMDSISKQGDVYTYQAKLIESATKLMSRSSYPTDVDASVVTSVIAEDKRLVFDYGLYNKVYLKWLYNAELNIAKQIARLQHNGRPLKYDNSLVTYAEELCGMTYARQQREAFTLLKKTGVAIVTGGPGTGKTTTVNGIISAYEKMYPGNVIKLCAPTGRAAQRMTESTGREAVTIHRLLDFRPYESDIICKNAENPIEADFIVVDEASMLDVEVASLFLSAIKTGTLVLFIGDINQLPSVGAGDVLHDMIASERIPCVQLTEVYRQKGTSPIVTNANLINAGEHELIQNDEFRIIHKESATAIPEDVVKAVMEYYDPKSPFDTTVLCPTHKGDAGVANINRILQSLLNPKGNRKELKYGARSFRQGDKIIMLQNNYSVGYYNGDLGIVTDIIDGGIEVNIMDKIINVTKDLMDDVNLAYAMTIHKSQGSEFKNVIISMPFEPRTMLKRNLIYTAVTRAKKNVVIVAEYGALDKSIDSVTTGTRKTDLVTRIRGEIDGKNIGVSA